MKKRLVPTVLATLVAALLLPAAAQAAPVRSGGDTAAGKDRITVGVRTSGEHAADNRGHYTYEIAPRHARQDFMALYNYATTPVTVRILPRDAATSEDGDFTAQPSAEKANDVGAWIVPQEDKIRLAPRSMTVVPFQIGVPYNATPGDHVGAIIVSLLAKDPSKKDGLIVEHRVGLRVYLRVPGALTPKLEIAHLRSTFTGRWTSLGVGSTDVSYEVRNTGNVRLSADQVVRLSRSLGLSAATVKPGAISEVLPGSTVAVHAHLGSRFAIGSLTTGVTLNPKGPSGSGVGTVAAVNASTSRFVLPWLLIVILLALLLIGGGYGRWRSRRRRASADSGPAEETASTEKEPAVVSRTSLSGKRSNKHAAPKSRVRRGQGATALGLIAVAMLAGVLGATGPAGRADAADKPAPTWKAVLDPASGADDEPFSIITSGACPAPARNVIGRIYGAGFPAAGVNVVGNTSGGVSQGGAFEMPLQESLRDTMVRQKHYVPYHGVYQLVVHCIVPAYVNRSYGDYVAKINFVTAQHWVALKPVTNVVGPHANADGSMTGPHVPGKPGKVTPPAAAGGTAGAQGGGAAAGDGTTAAGSPSATADATASSSSSRWPSIVLIGGGLLIAALTVFTIRRSRS